MEKCNIVFFDGVCPFCNNIVDLIWIRNSKRNIYYALLQSDYAKQFLMNIGITDIDFNTIYFFDGDNIYHKSRAVFKILCYLDGLYPIFYKISFIVPKLISDYCYDLVAKNRYKIFGKQVSCRIPNDEEKVFFLDQSVNS